MRRFLIPLAMLAPLAGCGQTPVAVLSPEQWRADLAYLAKELPARHIRAFATISKADFQAEVKDLDERIPKLTDGAIRAGLLRLPRVWGTATPTYGSSAAAFTGCQ